MSEGVRRGGGGRERERGREGRGGRVDTCFYFLFYLLCRQDLTDKAYPPPQYKFRPPELPPPKLPDAHPIDLVCHMCIYKF